MLLVRNVARFMFAVVVGIISALATVYCLNRPLPPWGWATNTAAGIALTTGVILFNCARLKLSLIARIPLCVFVLIVSGNLCLLGFSDDGPMMKSLLTLSILAAAISVGGMLAILILRQGQNSRQSTQKCTGSLNCGNAGESIK